MLIGATTTLNWHQNDFSASAELIDSFVSLMEQQAEDSVHKYNAEKKKELIQEDVEDDEHGMYRQVIETYGGLDNMAWSFEEVFEVFFPSLQRRSALLSVCGFFEYELHKLCVLFQRERKLRLGPYDLHGRGIEQSADYLNKVVGLSLNKKSQEWKAVARVRSIRNIIVHRDGRIRDGQNKILPEYKDVLAKLKHLNTEREEIVLEKGFVSQAVVTFKSYFKLIEDNIQENAKHQHRSNTA
jgi:hypothetical protein